MSRNNGSERSQPHLKLALVPGALSLRAAGLALAACPSSRPALPRRRFCGAVRKVRNGLDRARGRTRAAAWRAPPRTTARSCSDHCRRAPALHNLRAAAQLLGILEPEPDAADAAPSAPRRFFERTPQQHRPTSRRRRRRRRRRLLLSPPPRRGRRGPRGLAPRLASHFGARLRLDGCRTRLEGLDGLSVSRSRCRASSSAEQQLAAPPPREVGRRSPARQRPRELLESRAHAGRRS